MRPRIYTDTSVLGGCEDEELAEHSIRLMESFRFGHRERCCQMSKAHKKFDAVAMMRAARDKISAEIEGMTLEQELRWLASQHLEDPFLRRLRERVAQQADPGTRSAGGR